MAGPFRSFPTKTAFVAGEISPRLDGRTDLEQTDQGCRFLENFTVFPHGGATKRVGTYFAAEAKDHANETRVIPFQVADDVAYILELGNLYMRFYANEARVESPPGTPVEITTPFTSAMLKDVHYVQEVNYMWLTHPSAGHARRLERLTPTSFSLVNMKGQWHNGFAPMQTPNQGNTTITVTGAGPSHTLTFSTNIGLTTAKDVGRIITAAEDGDPTAWRNFIVTAVASGSVCTGTVQNGTVTSITTQETWALSMMSDTEGARTLTLAEGRFHFYGCPAEPNRLTSSVSARYDFFDYRTATDDRGIGRSLVSNAASVGQWLAPVNERLHAGSQKREFQVRGANDDIMTPASTVVKATSAAGSAHIQPQLVGNKVLFLQGHRQLVREISFSTEADSFEPIPISLLAEHILRSEDGTGGGRYIELQQVPDTVLWIPRDDGQLVGMTREPDAKIVALHRHLLGGDFQGWGWGWVESVAVISAPDGTYDQLWMVVRRTIDGADVRYIEYQGRPFAPSVSKRSRIEDRINAVEAAYFVDCGISFDNPLTISSIAKGATTVVTSTSHGLTNGDRVRLRKVRGLRDADGNSAVNNQTFLVRSTTTHTFQLHTLDDVDLDSSSYSAYLGGGTIREEFATFAGLDHLEGQTVHILADGGRQPDQVVVGGEVTLNEPASIVHIGLPCPSRGETTPFKNPQDPISEGIGVGVKIKSAVFRLHQTVGGKVGLGENGYLHPDEMIFREVADAMDLALPLYSGMIGIRANSGYDLAPVVYFEQDGPLPMTVLSITADVESAEH